jgi:hypothetical protein
MMSIRLFLKRRLKNWIIKSVSSNNPLMPATDFSMDAQGVGEKDKFLALRYEYLVNFT